MKYPPHMMIVDEDGVPQGVVDVEQLRRDASLLAYQFAASSGDNAELDRLGVEWSSKLTGAYYGGVLSGAFSLLVREILEPLLMVLDELRPDIGFRQKLAECRDEVARMTSGGGQ